MGLIENSFRYVVHVGNFLHVGKRGNKNEFIGGAHHERLLFIHHLTWYFIPKRNGCVVAISLAVFPVTAYAKRPGFSSMVVADDPELN